MQNRQRQGQTILEQNCWRNTSDRPFTIKKGLGNSKVIFKITERILKGFTLSWSAFDWTHGSRLIASTLFAFVKHYLLQFTTSVCLVVPKPKLKWALSHQRRNVCWTSFWGKQTPKLYVHRTAGTSVTARF